MQAIKEKSLSSAWLKAFEDLVVRNDGGSPHLIVAFDGQEEEVSGVREALDESLESFNEFLTQTVTNTIFPSGLYHPERVNARGKLYEFHLASDRVMKRYKGNQRGRYFSRMISWPWGEGVNQLEDLIHRLVKRKMSSSYEISLISPADGTNESSAHDDFLELDINIYNPLKDRKNLFGFPCLSHISFTKKGPILHMTAIYRNQDFYRKAYGNYCGLRALLHFVCHESGLLPGEIMCVATHAYLGSTKSPSPSRKQLVALVDRCHLALTASNLTMEVNL